MGPLTRFVLVVGAAAQAVREVLDDASVRVIRDRENVVLLEVPYERVADIVRAHPRSVHVYSALADAERAYGLFERDA